MPDDLTGCGLVTGDAERFGGLWRFRRFPRDLDLGAFFAFARAWFSRRVLRVWQSRHSSCKLSSASVPPSPKGSMWSSSSSPRRHFFVGFKQ